VYISTSFRDTENYRLTDLVYIYIIVVSSTCSSILLLFGNYLLGEIFNCSMAKIVRNVFVASPHWTKTSEPIKTNNVFLVS
jgi:hypothetical protein